ncbi:hypothetical protein OG21DRAFT_1483882 [Imleria badia]|nr:hypothetical protein OG21DRAFT_1483882 [Imleria badia]
MLPADLDDEQRAHFAHKHLNDLDSSASSPSSGTPAYYDSRRRLTSTSRQRSYTATDGCRNSYLLAGLLSLQEEVRKINAATVVTTERLEAEIFRADAAERRLNSFHRLRVPTENRQRAEQESARLREALELCNLQLENAKQEIFRAQDIIDQVASPAMNKPGRWKRLLAALFMSRGPLDDPASLSPRTRWEIAMPPWGVNDPQPRMHVPTESQAATVYSHPGPPLNYSASWPARAEREIVTPTGVDDPQPRRNIRTESQSHPGPPYYPTSWPARAQGVHNPPAQPRRDVRTESQSATVCSNLGPPLDYQASWPARAQLEIVTPMPLGDVDDRYPRRDASTESAAVYSQPPLNYPGFLPARTEFPPEHLHQARHGPGSSSMLNVIVELPTEPETTLSPSATVGAQPNLLNPAAANQPSPQVDAYQHQHHPPHSHSQLQSSRHHHHPSSSYDAAQSSGTPYTPRPAPSPSGHGTITFSSRPSPVPEQDHRLARAHPTPARTPNRNATLPNGHVRTHTQSASTSMGHGAVVWPYEAAPSVQPHTSRRRHRDRDRDRDRE